MRSSAIEIDKYVEQRSALLKRTNAAEAAGIDPAATVKVAFVLELLGAIGAIYLGYQVGKAGQDISTSLNNAINAIKEVGAKIDEVIADLDKIVDQINKAIEIISRKIDQAALKTHLGAMQAASAEISNNFAKLRLYPGATIDDPDIQDIITELVSLRFELVKAVYQYQTVDGNPMSIGGAIACAGPVGMFAQVHTMIERYRATSKKRAHVIFPVWDDAHHKQFVFLYDSFFKHMESESARISSLLSRDYITPDGISIFRLVGNMFEKTNFDPLKGHPLPIAYELAKDLYDRSSSNRNRRNGVIRNPAPPTPSSAPYLFHPLDDANAFEKPSEARKHSHCG